MTDIQIRCYELVPGSNGAATKNVNAGDTVGFRVDGGIQHPGPMQFYMAKAPSGQTAETFTGDGAVWFKIYEEHPTVTSTGLTWSSSGLLNVSVKIPSCLAPGYYLLRAEHIALHSAGSTGGAQVRRTPYSFMGVINRLPPDSFTKVAPSSTSPVAGRRRFPASLFPALTR